MSDREAAGFALQLAELRVDSAVVAVGDSLAQWDEIKGTSRELERDAIARCRDAARTLDQRLTLLRDLRVRCGIRDDD